ncbi:MAG TPA: T9SS type A sorting domain-containing protein, partial [Chitinophagaceae bacterium]|nr:T9SS type A sorting domain-containing protein [Chitinophagaceae bacterium]
LASPALVSPTITTPSNSLFTSATTSIIGSTDANATLTLYINGTIAQSTLASSGGAFTFSNLNLITGQQLYIVTELNTNTTSTSKCAAQTNAATVTCYTTAPLINADNNNQVTAGQPISGTSSEPVGTVIRVYTLSATSVSTLVSTVAVQNGGTWNTGGYTAVASTTVSYYATSQNGSCGVSGASGTSFAATATTGRCGSITAPVSASDPNIGGSLTGSASGTTVNLYQDGSLIGSVITASNTWSISSGSLIYPLYSGGILTIGIKEGTSQEQSCPSSSIVTCSSGPVAPNVSPPTSSVTPGQTQTFTISNAVVGAFYGLSSSTTGESLGNGVWAASNSVTLTTNTLPSGSYSIAVKGTSLSGVSVCSSSPSMTTLLVSAVLPLSMLRFDARKLSTGVGLSWATDHEMNTSYFEIERSSDGRNFEKAGQVKATSMMGRNEYGFMDTHPFPFTYYRLRMVDKNGTYSFSKVVSVLYRSAVNAIVQPNPFNELIQLNLALETEVTIRAEITDINGIRIFTTSFKGLRGNNQFLISGLQHIKPGLYMLSIRNATSMLYQQKIIKQAN